jgi:predicted permease
VDALVRDVRHAVRTLGQSPGFALGAVLSLGLGIGANATVFTWLDNIVRNPFPAIPGGATLVALNVGDQDGRVQGMAPTAYPTLLEWRQRTSSFEGVAAHAQARLNLRTTASALGEPIWVEVVDAHFFDVLGVRPGVGRLIDRQDERTHAAVAVLSHSFWLRRFGGEPDVIGRTLLLNGAVLTVVGVAPPRFDGVVTGLAFDAWVPLWQQPSLLPGSDWMRDPGARRLQAVARLRPGVSLGRANADLLNVAREVSRSYGESPVTGAGARWIGDTQLGSLMRPLGVAMIAVTAVVLLAACANVAGLLLSRSTGRQRETAIRVAVGASRARLAQQALVEAFLLSASGCVVAFGVAVATKDVLTSFVPRVSLPVSLTIHLNWRVVVFACVVAVGAALLVALAPAARASRLDIVGILKSAGPRAGPGRTSRSRRGLVVAQVAFSSMSLAIAVLFLRSVAAAGDVPLGFGDPHRVLLAATDLSFARVEESVARTALVDRALDAVRALPGVTAASAATSIPLSFGGPPGLHTRVEGYVPAPDEFMFVGRNVVGDGYFETMEIPLVEGRAPARGDVVSGHRVAVVNAAFVRRFWPGQSGVGRRIDQGDGWVQILGVARDSIVDSLTEPPRPLVYVPFGQVAPDALTFHLRVRPGTDPLLLVHPLRRVLAAVNADLPALDPGTLASHMEAGTFVQSVGASVFAVFGLLALAIAAAGLYGVVAAYVAERRREIAISVALGASPRIVASAVLTPALRLTVVGLAIGIVSTSGLSALVRSQVIGVSLLDAWALLSGAALLVLVTLATCAWPAWRAIRLDPSSALRCQ